VHPGDPRGFSTHAPETRGTSDDFRSLRFRSRQLVERSLLAGDFFQAKHDRTAGILHK